MEDENLVEFKVVYNKKKYEICFDINKDVGALKSHLQPTVPSKSELKKREEEESKADGGKESSESQKKQTAQKSPGKGEARRRHAGYQRKTRSTTVHTDFRDVKQSWCQSP